MDDPTFFVEKNPGTEYRDLIYQGNGDLRIKVICLGESDFQYSPAEMQLFADNDGEKLLFETVDYDHENPGLIIKAIKFYARYIGNPEMEIEAEME